MMPTPAVMIQGTGSDAGKSLLVAGLCRLFARQGLRVKPFKPQNMSNNAAATADGGEIGRAQMLQARAARVEASVHMNPVLLKPQSETGAQVVVQGRVMTSAAARDYAALKPALMAPVLDSFERVADRADLVIAEGAGSPAEINLRADDIANMGFAIAARVPVIVVADIARGGVIANLVGTAAVLPEADRAQVAGFLVNRFRGDVRLFDDGLSEIARRTGWPPGSPPPRRCRRRTRSACRRRPGRASSSSSCPACRTSRTSTTAIPCGSSRACRCASSRWRRRCPRRRTSSSCRARSPPWRTQTR
jgi:adenosylcobyric acid synthase